MRKKVTIHCLFWIFWYQDQIMVLKYLFTSGQLLVGYILSSIVSYTTNIKLVWFLLCYLLDHFQLSLTFPGFKGYLKSHLKDILRKKAFPIKLVDNCIKTFLNKKLLHTPVALTVKKKELFIALPYLGNLSLAIRTRLQNSINKNLLFCKIKVIFKSTTRLSNFFHFKDKVLFFNLHSDVVCKFSRGRCNATYCSETCRHLNIRVGEHSGVSPLSRKLKQLLLLKQLILRSFPLGLQAFGK